MSYILNKEEETFDPINPSTWYTMDDWARDLTEQCLFGRAAQLYYCLDRRDNNCRIRWDIVIDHGRDADDNYKNAILKKIEYALIASK